MSRVVAGFSPDLANSAAGCVSGLKPTTYGETIQQLKIHCRAVRVLGGTAPGWLVRQGLMSRPPRRV